jgi:pSer/pThr/pTyr-binding forkhead associated (FHA) protein
MSDALLALLRIFLLVLIYLFFLRVVRAVWVEVRAPAPAVATAGAGRKARREARAQERAARPARSERRPASGPALVVTEPPELRGRIYDLSDSELTIGRAAGCTVTVDDTFVSQLHARVFARDDQLMVEDLGSTNGTYLNRRRLTGPMVVQRSDKIQIGNTVLEVR